MIRVITIDDIRNLMRKVTLKTFMLYLFDNLERDFTRWQEFDKKLRFGNHYPNGVIELMPISDKDYYSFKFVTSYPGNPLRNKQTVVGVGLLADIATGYPVLMSEMTILTAIRTAVTSALASTYLAPKCPKTFGIIGTGAQSEFQVLAHHYALDVDEIYYYDFDGKAMQKFSENLSSFELNLHPCEDARSVVENSVIVTTATAEKTHAKVIHGDWIESAKHLNSIGGDAPGKTELDPNLITKCKIVVEFMAQSELEGESQYFSHEKVYAELWELVSGKKLGRESKQEITLFDSVGFAVEDYSILRLVYALAEEYHIGHMMDMIPETDNSKDLYSLLH